MILVMLFFIFMLIAIILFYLVKMRKKTVKTAGIYECNYCDDKNCDCHKNDD